jgi:hypothetical protein
MNYDFSKMRFNPIDLPKGKSMLDVYPVLKNYEEFLDLKLDNMLKFAVLMTDTESPLFNITDAPIKVDTALELAGYKKDEDGIKDGSNAKCNAIIVRFLMIFANTKYSLLFAQKQHFYNQIQTLMTPVDITDDKYEQKQKIKNDISLALQNLERSIAMQEANLFEDEFTKNAFDFDSSIKFKMIAENYSQTDEDAY